MGVCEARLACCGCHAGLRKEKIIQAGSGWFHLDQGLLPPAKFFILRAGRLAWLKAHRAAELRTAALRPGCRLISGHHDSQPLWLDGKGGREIADPFSIQFKRGGRFAGQLDFCRAQPLDSVLRKFPAEEN